MLLWLNGNGIQRTVGNEARSPASVLQGTQEKKKKKTPQQSTLKKMWPFN